MIDQRQFQSLQAGAECGHLPAQFVQLSLRFVVHGCPRVPVVDGDRNHSTGASVALGGGRA